MHAVPCSCIWGSASKIIEPNLKGLITAVHYGCTLWAYGVKLLNSIKSNQHDGLGPPLHSSSSCHSSSSLPLPNLPQSPSRHSDLLQPPSLMPSCFPRFPSIVSELPQHSKAPPSLTHWQLALLLMPIAW
jgi:hypothetical protein